MPFFALLSYRYTFIFIAFSHSSMIAAVSTAKVFLRSRKLNRKREKHEIKTTKTKKGRDDGIKNQVETKENNLG